MKVITSTPTFEKEGKLKVHYTGDKFYPEKVKYFYKYNADNLIILKIGENAFPSEAFYCSGQRNRKVSKLNFPKYRNKTIIYDYEKNEVAELSNKKLWTVSPFIVNSRGKILVVYIDDSLHIFGEYCGVLQVYHLNRLSDYLAGKPTEFMLEVMVETIGKSLGVQKAYTAKKSSSRIEFLDNPKMDISKLNLNSLSDWMKDNLLLGDIPTEVDGELSWEEVNKVNGIPTEGQYNIILPTKIKEIKDCFVDKGELIFVTNLSEETLVEMFDIVVPFSIIKND